MRGSAFILAAFLAACGGSPAPESKACAGPGTICRIAGTGELAFNEDGHKALDTALYLISAVQRGPDGLLYLMDFNNFRLRVIEPDDTVHTVVGSGDHAGATDGAPALESPLENPIDFAFDRDGSVVIVQLHDPRVLRVGKDGLVHVIAGDSNPGTGGDGGPALQAQFLDLHSVAIDGQGGVYVADGSGHRVRKITPDGNIEAFAGTGSDILGDDGDGLPAQAANMGTPEALAVGPDGSVYIAISGGSVLRKVRPDGIIETLAGDGHSGFGGDGGPAKDALLARPSGVAVAADGTVYVADTGNERIRRIGTDGVIQTIAGDGKAGTDGDGGPALAASLHGPARLALDGDSLLVADQLSSCARRIRLR